MSEISDEQPSCKNITKPIIKARKIYRINLLTTIMLIVSPQERPAATTWLSLKALTKQNNSYFYNKQLLCIHADCCKIRKLLVDVIQHISTLPNKECCGLHINTML